MKGLDGIEMHGDVALREFPPSDEVLAGCQRLELRRHEAHRQKWLVTPHEDVFWYPIQNFWISLVITGHPCCKISNVLTQQLRAAVVRT